MKFWPAIYFIAAIFLPALPSWSQISVRVTPPAVLAESTVAVTLAGQVSGTLPGESTAVRWTLNDQFVSNASQISVTPAAGPPGVQMIMKAASVFDPTRFAAAPVIGLESATLAQISFPNAVAYHPATQKVYVGSIVATGPTTFNTNIVEVSSDGSQAPVLTLNNEIVEKLLPFQSGGTSYLLAVGVRAGSVIAVNLGSKTSRNVVTGLQAPVSGALHPASGDLYVAEQTPRRISRVSRQALDSAVGGSSAATAQPLPVTIPNISGVGFLVDQESRVPSLLATATNGIVYQIKLEDNTFDTVASGLRVVQEPLAVESPTLGFSFVILVDPTTIDGQGRISVAVPRGTGQPLSLYVMAIGLDLLTDSAFIPAGTPFNAGGGPVMVAANSSPTAARGRIVLWRFPAGNPQSFFNYNDRAQPSLSLISPADGAALSPGAPIEVRWSAADGNPANPSDAHFPAMAEIMVSTDGGNSYFSGGTPLLASGPRGHEYRLPWQVPASLAGQSIRIRVQTKALEGSTISSDPSGAMTVLAKGAGAPVALTVSPNFALTGASSEVTFDGLNFQEGTAIDLDDGFTIEPADNRSASRMTANITIPALEEPGPRTVRLCNGEMNCGEMVNGFFALPGSAPRITATLPQSGAPGASVLISGANFSPVSTNNVVRFGELVASVSQAQPGSMIVQVPFGVSWGKVPVSVETNGVASNTADFVLTPPGGVFAAINRDGIVNAASYAPGTAPLAAGAIASAFGLRLAGGIAGATQVPLPRALLGTRLQVGGVEAPLFFAAPNQVNFQLPEELRGLNSAPARFIVNGIPGNTALLNLAAQTPGLFSRDGTGAGQGAVLNQDGSLNGPGNPERIGRILQVYANGLGETVPLVPTGTAAASEPLALSSASPGVTIDGKPAAVDFSGRAPFAVGLDQINVVIPDGAATGTGVPLKITANSRDSNTVTVFLAP